MICFLCHMHFSFFVRCIFLFCQIQLSSFFLLICLAALVPWLGQMKLSVSCLEQVKTPSASEIWITFFSSIIHCRKFGNPINVKEIKAELFLINLWKMLLSLLSFFFYIFYFLSQWTGIKGDLCSRSICGSANWDFVDLCHNLGETPQMRALTFQTPHSPLVSVF